MQAYLDNSATTVVTPEVAEVVLQMMTKDFGNPSAQHTKGFEAEKIMKASREAIAKTLHCSEKEIYFTSGATESNNWAIYGACMANRRAGNHLITTAVEHASILMPMKFMEEQGFRVTYLPVDETGHVSLKDLEEALDEDTILVSMMYVNNEVGAVMPIAEAAKLVHGKCKNALFHVDAVQAYGKLPINPKKEGIDLLSVSGHKLHGPKGSGFLYMKEGIKFRPMILGGGQQKGWRSGTDNVPGSAGLAKAAEIAYKNLAASTGHMQALRKRLMDGLAEIPNVVLHSTLGPECAPHIVSASFVGVRSEVLLHALEDKEIYISAGSACSSNKTLPVSTVLQEMHLPREQQESTVRMSLCELSTEEEIDYALEALKSLVPMLRKYSRH